MSAEETLQVYLIYIFGAVTGQSYRLSNAHLLLVGVTRNRMFQYKR